MPQFREMHGRVLYQRRHDWGTGLIVASERAQHSHWYFLKVRTHNKCWKVLDDELPTQSTTVGHVGGVSGSDMYGGGGGGFIP